MNLQVQFLEFLLLGYLLLDLQLVHGKLLVDPVLHHQLFVHHTHLIQLGLQLLLLIFVVFSFILREVL